MYECINCGYEFDHPDDGDQIKGLWFCALCYRVVMGYVR